MTKLLMIDDDQELCELLIEIMELEGFHLHAVHEGVSGLERALSGEYQMVLLDVGLPGQNGFDLLKELRKTSEIPVIMLTARGDDVDRIIGLEIGADDYLPKPFNERELIARIKAILKRTTSVDKQKKTSSTKILIDDLIVNPENRQVLLNGQVIELTTTEFTVLKTLVERAGTLVKKSELSQIALGRGWDEFDRSIDVHISNLRKKIGAKPDHSPRIKNVRGVGYFYISDLEE